MGGTVLSFDIPSAAVAFLAASVEMVEALTIVLAAGVSRGWKSALAGAGGALILLLLVVGIFGLAVLRVVPLPVLRVVLGLFLLLFGLKWLKKAMQHASGRKSAHAEDEIYAYQVKTLSAQGPRRTGIDGEGFATAFNGMLLEGMEVALIIVAVGSASSAAGAMGSAAVGAALAFLAVAAIGFALRSPLSKVPENLIKFVVGIMLTTFGSFWTGEGLGVKWPGADLSVLFLIAGYVLVSVIGVKWLKAGAPAKPGRPAHAAAASGGRAS